MEPNGGVVGYKTAAAAAALTEKLRRRGCSRKSEIGKIWSGNFFRVWREVRAAAQAPD